jgi:hypothetical protein
VSGIAFVCIKMSYVRMASIIMVESRCCNGLRFGGELSTCQHKDQRRNDEGFRSFRKVLWQRIKKLARSVFDSRLLQSTILAPAKHEAANNKKRSKSTRQ